MAITFELGVDECGTSEYRIVRLYPNGDYVGQEQKTKIAGRYPVKCWVDIEGTWSLVKEDTHRKIEQYHQDKMLKQMPPEVVETFTL